MSLRLRLFLTLVSTAATLFVSAAGFELLLSRSDKSSVASNALSIVATTSTSTGTPVETTGTEQSATGNFPDKGADPVVIDPKAFDFVQSGVTLPDDVEVWHRENAYRLGQLSRIQGGAPLPLGNHVESPEDKDKDAFRVLVVGDSFVFGFGINDLDRVWHRVLANKLAERFGAGSYEFNTVSHIGTSILSYSENLSEEAIQTHKPDLIVIGFLPNDWMADGSERRICGGRVTNASSSSSCTIGAWYTRPAYVSCLEGKSNLIGALLRKFVKPVFPRVANSLTERMCDPKSYPEDPLTPNQVGDMVADPESSPYWSLYVDSIATIRRNAGSIPVLALPTATNGYKSSPVVYETLRKGGIGVIPTPRTAAMLKEGQSFDKKSLWVNPADPHPDTALHNAYAEDAFDFIEREYPNISPERTYDMALLSNYTPSSMTISSDGDQVTLSHSRTNASTLAQTTTNDYRTVPRLPQAAPCAPYGRPHSRVVFNPQVLSKPFNAIVTLEKSERALVFSTVSYDSTGREVISKPVRLAVGEPVDYRFDTNTTGFIVGADQTGCSLNQEIHLTSFTLNVAKL